MAGVRVGIIGSGFGGQVHLPGFAGTAGVQVLAIADSGSGRAQQIAKQAGIPRAYSDWREIVDAPDIDAVSVATPPERHAAIVGAALKAGKHVLCEKPFGKTLAEAECMTRWWSESERVGAIDFLFRMEPGIAELRRRALSGAIGKLKRIDVAWLTGGRADPSRPFGWQHDVKAGGGVLGAMASHVFDYVEWIAASTIHSVYVHGQVLIPRRPVNQQRDESVTAEDCVDIVGELESGAILSGRISNCYRYGHGHRIEVDGEDGRLVFHHRPPFTSSDVCLSIQGRTGEQIIPIAVTAGDGGRDTRITSFRGLAEQFVAQIRGDQVDDLPEFDAGLRARQVLCAAEQSLVSGKGVPCPC